MLFLALFTAMAVLLNSFDILVTAPFPFVKVGLAHVISVLTAYMFGRKEAVLVIFFKVLIVSLIWGRLGTPSFLISVFGNAAAALFVITMLDRVSITAFSIGAAFFNNLGQVSAVRWFFVPNGEMRYLYTIIFISGIFTGMLIGMLSGQLLKRLRYEHRGI